MALRQRAFHQLDEDVGSLLAYGDATLLDGGEHRVASHSSLTIRKSAYRNVLRHTIAHAFRCIEDADGGVVVDGKERIGNLLLREYLRRNGLSISAVVADVHPFLTRLQPLSQQSIAIAVIAVLRNLERHRCTVVGNTSTTRVDKMRNGIEGSHVVVDDHARSIHTCANAVVEHQWHTHVDELLEVVVFLRVLGLRDDDATHLMLIERLTDSHFAIILLVALRNHDAIAARRGLLFNTT